MARPDAARKAQAAHRRDRLILWASLGLGLALFVASLLGNIVGFTVLPFDPHHIFGQIVGIALVLYGLTRWR
ncbi:hypothetical protein ABZ313_24045 [Streptomyces sp. NPDC006251]|uniref:hypothetical protein n=1 Tax=Streptomyces sp. NPDC006251 TaxID=3155718 RepID=UPI0033AD0810